MRALPAFYVPPVAHNLFVELRLTDNNYTLSENETFTP